MAMPFSGQHSFIRRYRLATSLNNKQQTFPRASPALLYAQYSPPLPSLLPSSITSTETTSLSSLYPGSPFTRNPLPFLSFHENNLLLFCPLLVLPYHHTTTQCLCGSSKTQFKKQLISTPPNKDSTFLSVLQAAPETERWSEQ